MLGGAVAGWAIDAVGRKSALMFSAVLNLIGWLLLAGADSWRDPTGFKSLLLIGRFFTGAGLGWSMLCAPVSAIVITTTKCFYLFMQVYIGEVSTPVLRGLFGTLPMVSVSVGVLLVYLLGAIPGFSYQYISLVALAITAVFVLLVAPPWVPMTPRYLIMKGRWEEALRELKWLRGPNVKISEEAEDTKQVVVGTRRLTWRELFSELTKRKSIISLTLTIFAVAAQQLSGVDALIFFAGDLFNNVGFANPQLFASITIGVVSLLTTLASLVLVDLFGRKVLLISSGLTMAVSTFGLGAAFYITQHISGSDMKPLFIASAILFSVGFSVGWGSIPFILMSELLPLQTRGVLAGMVAIVNWGCGALVSGAYNWFAGLVQPYGAWWAFGILNLLSSVCVAVFLPETKGKKLEYIEDMLQNRYRLCVWR